MHVPLPSNASTMRHLPLAAALMKWARDRPGADSCMLRWQVLEIPNQSPSQTRCALPAGLERAINLMLRTDLHLISSCLRGRRGTEWRAFRRETERKGGVNRRLASGPGGAQEEASSLGEGSRSRSAGHYSQASVSKLNIHRGDAVRLPALGPIDLTCSATAEQSHADTQDLLSLLRLTWSAPVPFVKHVSECEDRSVVSRSQPRGLVEVDTPGSIRRSAEQ
ncbi:hypothetical protein B0T14DRAFT_137281 [Immersiella caudata]|uniref:Uncharacterized protein n=1 Tax=Immersiella caudata TaxID=314043 RepID=A0AA39X562_9PEZI|nr:hypothetical protein B0T14DRAFT_137281 [Immersiella caudata]